MSVSLSGSALAVPYWSSFRVHTTKIRKTSEKSNLLMGFISNQTINQNLYQTQRHRATKFCNCLPEKWRKGTESAASPHTREGELTLWAMDKKQKTPWLRASVFSITLLSLTDWHPIYEPFIRAYGGKQYKSKLTSPACVKYSHQEGGNLSSLANHLAFTTIGGGRCSQPPTQPTILPKTGLTVSFPSAAIQADKYGILNNKDTTWDSRPTWHWQI